MKRSVVTKVMISAAKGPKTIKTQKKNVHKANPEESRVCCQEAKTTKKKKKENNLKDVFSDKHHKRQRTCRMPNLSDITPQSYGVNLYDNEKEILKLPPKFSVFDNLSENDFEQKVEQMNAKLRYETHRDNMEEIEEEQVDVTPEEKSRIGMLEVEAQQVLNGKQ